MREFFSNRLAIVGLGVLVFFVVFSFAGPLFYHTNQSLTNPLTGDLAPSWGHVVGTDDNGFDELGRMMAGGQTALLVPAPEVPDYLGDLVHVTGGELLQVGLVPA